MTARRMWMIGVEGDRFMEHDENKECAVHGCVSVNPDPMDKAFQDLDLSGLNPEVIRNYVQLQKVKGTITNETRAMVVLLAAYDRAVNESSLWENHARRLGYDPRA